MKQNLYEKIFNQNVIRQLDEETYQLFIDTHLMHEATSAPAFAMLEETGQQVLLPNRTFATLDHVIPTTSQARPFDDAAAETMATALEQNCKRHGIRYFSTENKEQGIIHVVANEQGLVHPGQVVACADSHTSTHGALGAIAFGIGTSQVRDILASQSLLVKKLKVRRIFVQETLPPGVSAKDLVLFLIQKLGVKAGLGYAYEFAGPAIEALSIDERLTLCNMGVEAGARVAYIGADEKTLAFLKNKPYAPENWQKAKEIFCQFRSDVDAYFDDEVVFRASDVKPMVTWGITPDQVVAVDEPISAKAGLNKALKFSKFSPGEKVDTKKIDVAFLGSCTNGRFSDFETVAKFLQQTGFRAKNGVTALAVPGSQKIYDQLVEAGYDLVFRRAGFEFRLPGCSMCLAMNDDKLRAGQVCASSSNRNFIGRQGSAKGHTMLMSPIMVTLAAVFGHVVDARAYLN